MPAVEVSDEFVKKLRRKSAPLQRAIMRCVGRLGENPRHPSLQAHQVLSTGGVWEAYVDTGNRVTFHYGEDGRIILRTNCNHDILRRNP